jgi:hypothetical protein
MLNRAWTRSGRRARVSIKISPWQRCKDGQQASMHMSNGIVQHEHHSIRYSDLRLKKATRRCTIRVICASIFTTNKNRIWSLFYPIRVVQM